MTEMQEMFDLNTAIDQLKNVLSKDYHFEVNDRELKAEVHIFAQNEKYSEIVQDAFTQFNRSVKDSLTVMIDQLIDKRDEMTLKILSNQAKENYKTMDNIHHKVAEEYCDGLDCDTCIDPNCPRKAEDIKESLSE